MNSYIVQTKDWLEEKGHITSWEAIQEMGNTRLSATIHVLRHNYEMPIEMEMRTAPNGKRYGYYYLAKEQ